MSDVICCYPYLSPSDVDGRIVLSEVQGVQVGYIHINGGVNNDCAPIATPKPPAFWMGKEWLYYAIIMAERLSDRDTYPHSQPDLSLSLFTALQNFCTTRHWTRVRQHVNQLTRGYTQSMQVAGV